MAKRKMSVLKVNDWSIYPYQLPEGKSDSEGFRGINIRITNRKKSIDIEAYDKTGLRIKCKTGQFQNGQIQSGYDAKLLNDLNSRLRDLQSLIRQYVEANPALDKQSIITFLYNSLNIGKRKRTKYITIPVTVYGRVIDNVTVTSDVMNKLPQLQQYDEDGLPLIEDEEDANVQILDLVEDHQRKEKLKEIENMSPADRYKNGYWNRKNIFECVGYLIYGKKKNAAGKEVELLAEKWHVMLKRLIDFRENNPTVSSSIKDLNADWVHEFYRFTINRKGNKHIPLPTPFKQNPEYLVEQEFETYGINTFRENIDKGMKRVITELYRNELIPSDFKEKIKASDFGDINYDEKIYNLALNEFLKLYKADLKAGSIEDKTRDAFILMCIQGERKSDYSTAKFIQDIDSIKAITYKQPKTGNLINNVLLEPAKKIYEKYGAELPAIGVNFNKDLRKIATDLKLKREIRVPIKKVGEKTKYNSVKLNEFISTKFARGTFYMLGAIMGKSFEELRLIAGHTSGTSIVFRHYWQVGHNYTQDEVAELLKIYK